jgi:hypothetical protein
MPIRIRTWIRNTGGYIIKDHVHNFPSISAVCFMLYTRVLLHGESYDYITIFIPVRDLPGH